jgi:hypothetical protein
MSLNLTYRFTLATARLYRVVDNDNSEEKGILYILLI